MSAQQQTLPLDGFAQDAAITYRGDHLLVAEMVERFIALVEAGRWPVRDPRSLKS